MCKNGICPIYEPRQFFYFFPEKNSHLLLIVLKCADLTIFYAFFSIVADAGKFVDNEALPPRQRAGEARPWSLEINVGGTKIYTTVATLERSS